MADSVQLSQAQFVNTPASVHHAIMDDSVKTELMLVSTTNVRTVLFARLSRTAALITRVLVLRVSQDHSVKPLFRTHVPTTHVLTKANVHVFKEHVMLINALVNLDLKE
ncbi:uncharacterized protein [Amphiura filiformis]|uniref:uncharacterized protein n=1 Tax=Amphiura filiformis TaxID=82378 RepID=UPI003B21DCF1